MAEPGFISVHFVGALVVVGVLAAHSVDVSATESSGTQSAFGVSITIDFADSPSSASGSSLLVQGHQRGRITLEVWDARDDSPWREPVDGFALLEVRHPGGSRERIDSLNQVAVGTYQLDFDFDEVGDWLLVVLPDLPDRSSLPPGSADTIEVTIEAISPGEGEDSAVALTVVLILTLTVAILVRAATKKPKPSVGRTGLRVVPHDSWWNSP